MRRHAAYYGALYCDYLARRIANRGLGPQVYYAVGFDDLTVHRGIENGRANPELDTLDKIAAALGVHPHELLGNEARAEGYGFRGAGLQLSPGPIHLVEAVHICSIVPPLARHSRCQSGWPELRQISQITPATHIMVPAALATEAARSKSFMGR